MADKPLLPPSSELASLPSETAQSVVQLVDRENQLEANYAVVALVCGLISFLACISAYVALCILGHPAEAGAVLTVGVLNIVGRFISARK